MTENTSSTKILIIEDEIAIAEGLIDLCNESGVGFISFSPLAQGLLTNRYLNGVPTDSRMAKEHFLKKSALTEELLLSV